MLEEHAFFVLIAGLALVVAAHVWLVVRAFKTRKAWGVALLLVPPLDVVFVVAHLRRAVGPLLLFLMAGVLLASPFAYNWYQEHYVDLGPRERTVDGELHITLTDWEQSDYSLLRRRPQTVVLQMANADVDDGTLAYLEGMKSLRELDLSGTKVTDAGLAVLARLPRLEEVHLARTKITDEGFRSHLAGKASLRKLDLRGTAVKSKTKREWKKESPGRECLD
jgi:hypothetical protein